jgi:hypothetical protein
MSGFAFDPFENPCKLRVKAIPKILSDKKVFYFCTQAAFSNFIPYSL